MNDRSDPIIWQIDDELLVCSRYQDTTIPDEYLCVGFVADAMTRVPTGNMFVLIEQDGEVLQVFQAPFVLFERLVSMINASMDEFQDELDSLE